MSEPLALVLACAAGGALGAFFFGGLWWTVRKGVSAKQPALWFLASVLLRTSVVLVGFYFVGDGDWKRILSCVAGFAVARPLVRWLTRPARPPRARAATEAGHAP